MYLKEFANLSKELTGLDEIIWVDTGQTYLNGKHYKRLKVYLDNSKSRSLSYSLIDGNCLELKKKKIQTKDLPKDDKDIRQFIFNYQKELLDLSDGLITKDEFKEIIKNKSINESVNNNVDYDMVLNNYLDQIAQLDWEDIKDEELDEEMYDVLYLLLYTKENEKELEEIFDNAFDSYLNNKDVVESVNILMDGCKDLFWKKITPFIEEGSALFDDIDAEIFANKLSKLILGIND